MMVSCSVLVIGGAGFLGQHVISVLQSRAPFVTEIRALDVVPYQNKLEHEERVPVQVYTGSVTDEGLVTEACRGVNIIIHLATVIDISMFPDVARTMNVNVNGPSTVVKVATKTASVYGFIFSSSVAIHMGRGGSGVDLTEDSPIPEHRYYEPYSTSKIKAEKIVLEANGPSLSTVVIRPSIMYGELDYASQSAFDTASKLGGWIFEIKTNGARHQQAYVGNVAWGFVCAAKILYEQQTSLTGSPRKQSRDISGEAYIMIDDTEPISTFEKERYFLEQAGLKYLWFKVPLSLMVLILNIVYIILKLCSFVGVKQNVQYSASLMEFFYHDYVFSGKKAKDRLGYTPIFEISSAKKRSIEYYRRCWAETKSKR